MAPAIAALVVALVACSDPGPRGRPRPSRRPASRESDAAAPATRPALPVPRPSASAEASAADLLAVSEAFVRMLLEIPDPSPSPMFHPYSGAVAGDALALSIASPRATRTTLQPVAGFGRGPYPALTLPLRIENTTRSPASITLAHEWHGGVWRPTDLYGCTVRIGDEGPPLCQQIYLVPEVYRDEGQTTIRAAGTRVVEVRMDFAGTPSVHGVRLMDPNETASYLVRAIALHRQAGQWRYGLSAVATVEVSSGRQEGR